MSLFQHTKNGQVVELVSYHDSDYAMVRNSAGAVTYVPLSDLVSYEAGKGRTGEVPQPVLAKDEVDKDAIPVQPIPEDSRLNLNTATAEIIASRIKGIGYSTAKLIVEKRTSLPGERFVNLDQVRKVGRVNWDQVIEDDLVFVA